MGRSFVRVSALCLGVSTLGVACDNSNTLVLEPNPATRVILDRHTCVSGVDTCGQCLFRAEAFDKNGQPAPFPTLLWSSSNPSRATVDQAGRVSGWRPGNVLIRVEVQETGASDEEEISVRLDPNGPCNPPAHLSPTGPWS